MDPWAWEAVTWITCTAMVCFTIALMLRRLWWGNGDNRR